MLVVASLANGNLYTLDGVLYYKITNNFNEMIASYHPVRSLDIRSRVNLD